MSYFESACTNHIKQQIDFDSSPLIRHSSRQSSVTTLSHVVDIYKPSPVQCSQHSSQEFVSERQALLDSLGKVAAKEKQPSFEVHRFHTHSFPNHISRDRFETGAGRVVAEKRIPKPMDQKCTQINVKRRRWSRMPHSVNIGPPPDYVGKRSVDAYFSSGTEEVNM